MSHPVRRPSRDDPVSRPDLVRQIFWLLTALALLLGPTVPAANQPPGFQLPPGTEDHWLPRENERDWSSIASSADGRHLVATVRGGRVFASSDFGLTWTARESDRAWQSITSSADGRRLAAAVDGGQIHVSSDAGVTWSARENPRRWRGMASSSDGLRLAAVVDGGRIHTSADAGASWTARATERSWTGIASSADGRHLAAVAHIDQIHTSSDAGETWTARALRGTWKAITSSADGRILAAAATNGRIHVSTNHGVAWTELDSNPEGGKGMYRQWQAITCSADGRTLAAVETPEAGTFGPGHVLISTNLGASWTSRARRLAWSGIAAAADGRRFAAVTRGGSIYTLEETTSRHTRFLATNSGKISLPSFATQISPGPVEESSQRVQFHVSTDHPELFSEPPLLDPYGTLTLATGPRPGRATVTVIARDNRGPAEGGLDTSAPQSFSLAIQGRAFTASAWTDDASTGLSRSATLWAYAFGDARTDNTVINGVSVPRVRGVNPSVPGRFSLAGLDGSLSDLNFLTAAGGRGSARLAESFVVGGRPALLTLEGLTAGTPYTLHAYTVGWQGSRSQLNTWSADNDRSDVDAYQLGDDQGLRVSHSFAATGPIHRILVTPVSGATWHFYGLALNTVPAGLAVEQPVGSGLASGDRRDFGGFPLGPGTQLTFSLRNPGVAPLADLTPTLEGVNPGDFEVTTFPSGPIPGPEGNSQFTVEFSPSAIGPRSARLRIDSNAPEPFVLDLAGTGLPDDAFLVRDIPDQTIDEDGSTASLAFTVGNPAPGRTLTIRGRSSDPTLVPDANILVSGSGPERRLVVRPAPDRSGSAVIRLMVGDGTRSSSHLFTLTVKPVNDPPGFDLPAGITTPAGASWTSRESHRNWRAIAASHDGRRLAAAVQGGRIHTSDDAGLTWIPRDTDRSWTAIASSADGLRLAATVGGGPIFTSTDAGHSWQARASQRPWVAIAGSAGGDQLAAVVDGGQIYTSTNAGLTWVARERNRAWKSIASSAEGRRLAAAVNEGQIYTSADAGETWIPREQPRDWTAIFSSADGLRLAATCDDGQILISTNSGATWVARNTVGFWHAIAGSTDGRRLAVAETLGRLHFSADFGITWTPAEANRDWGAVAYSADGRTLAAAVISGPLLTSTATTATYAVAVGVYSGPASIRDFATRIAPGPADESGQSVSFLTSTDNPSLFVAPPAIDARGTLTFIPADQPGVARVDVVARDGGGTEGGGANTSTPRRFQIVVQGRGFHTSAWTDDVSSGLSRASTLWAYRFGAGPTNTAWIDGVPVPHLGASSLFAPGRLIVLGVPSEGRTDNELRRTPAGGSALLAEGDINGGNPAILSLEGLIPGSRYTLLSHSVGRDYDWRSPDSNASTWSSGNDVAEIDANQFGRGNGIRVAYTFTADSTNRIITVSPKAGKASWGFHTLALNAAPAALALEQPSGSRLADGDTRDFGSHSPGAPSPSSLTFTLRNTGTVPLTDLVLTLDGANADEFQVRSQPAATVAGPDGTTTFAVQFVPRATGPRTATLRLASNDPRHRPFVLNLIGTGTAVLP